MEKNKPGPRVDVETARKVADIVARTVSVERWQDRIEDVCRALDDAKIRRPKTWRNRRPPISSWSNATVGDDRKLAKKAIAHHVENARKF